MDGEECWVPQKGTKSLCPGSCIHCPCMCGVWTVQFTALIEISPQKSSAVSKALSNKEGNQPSQKPQTGTYVPQLFSLILDFFEAYTSEVFPPALWVRLALFSLEESWNYYFILVLWQWDSLSWIETLLGLVQQKQNKGMFPSPKITQYQSLTQSWLSKLCICRKKPRL